MRKRIRSIFTVFALCLSMLSGLMPGMATTVFAAGSYNIGDTVNFAGHEWYIIGTDSEGVQAPSGSYTLFAKNNDFGRTAFRQNNDDPATSDYYKDSDLQKKMQEIANGFSEADRAHIVIRDNLDDMRGDPVTDQLLWPISIDECGELGWITFLRSFPEDYWTRKGIGKGEAYTVRANGLSYFPYTVVTEVHAVRPAMYVKLPAREVEFQNNGTHLQWRYVGESNDKWRNLLALSDITGTDGKNGKRVELRVEGDFIQWKYDADPEDNWQNLMPLSALKGVDGEDGQDGVTPQLRINADTNMWEVSYDNGATWTSLGVKATGSDGQDGADGLTPYIGSTDTGIKAAGANGTDGKNGADGKDGANGQDGADGVGIADIQINENGELVVTLTDSTEKNLGKVTGEDGVGISGVAINENGELIVTLTDGTELNAGIVWAAEMTAMGNTEDSNLKALVYVSVGTAGVSLAGLIAMLAFLLIKRKSLRGK